MKRFFPVFVLLGLLIAFSIPAFAPGWLYG